MRVAVRCSGGAVAGLCRDGRWGVGDRFRWSSISPAVPQTLRIHHLSSLRRESSDLAISIISRLERRDEIGEKVLLPAMRITDKLFQHETVAETTLRYSSFVAIISLNRHPGNGSTGIG